MMRCVSAVAVSRAAISALALSLASPVLANEQETPAPAPAAGPSAGGGSTGSGPTGSGGPIGAVPAAAAGGEPEFVYDRGPRPPDPEIRIPPPLGDDHPLVRPYVAANPGKDLVLCLAGCRREPGIVTARPSTKGARPATVSEHMPKAAVAPAGAAPAPSPAAAATSGPLDCIAGC